MYLKTSPVAFINLIKTSLSVSLIFETLNMDIGTYQRDVNMLVPSFNVLANCFPHVTLNR